jgi:hypothetical protein
MAGQTFPSGLYNGTTYQYWSGTNWKFGSGTYDNIDNTYGTWFVYDDYQNATRWLPTGSILPIWSSGYTIKELYIGIEGYADNTTSASFPGYLTPFWSGSISGTTHVVNMTGILSAQEQMFWFNIWDDASRPTTITFNNITGLYLTYGGGVTTDQKPDHKIDAIYLYVGYEADEVITYSGNLTIGRCRQTDAGATDYYYMQDSVQGIRNVSIWHRDLNINEIKIISKNPNIFKNYPRTYCGKSKLLSSFYVVTGDFSGEFLGGYHYSGDSNYSVSQFPRYIYTNQNCFIHPDDTGSWYISSNDTLTQFYRQENEVSANTEYPTGVYINQTEYPGGAVVISYLYVI